MKIAKYAGIVCGLLLLGCDGTQATLDDNPQDVTPVPKTPLVPIPDVGLQDCIANTPGIPGDALYQDDYDGVKVLRCYFKDVYSLQGIENFRHLEVLSLGWQYKGTELPAQQVLDNLVELRVAGAPISDLTPLENAQRLTYLDIGLTSVTQLDSLAGLTNLQHLFIDNLSPSALNPIAGLSQLEVVLGSFTEQEERFFDSHKSLYLLFNTLE